MTLITGISICGKDLIFNLHKIHFPDSNFCLTMIRLERIVTTFKDRSLEKKRKYFEGKILNIKGKSQQKLIIAKFGNICFKMPNF